MLDGFLESLVLTKADVKIEKRALLHGAIASPYAGKTHPKVVYVSSKTPFMSAFKHVKQLLKHVEKRDTQSELLQAKKNGRRGGFAGSKAARDRETEPVFIKATGRAIEKALQLALFLQQQQDLEVKIRTSTSGAIDDLVYSPKIDADGADADEFAMDVSVDAEMGVTLPGGHNELEKLPESRLRHTSVIDIEVKLR